MTHRIILSRQGIEPWEQLTHWIQQALQGTMFGAISAKLDAKNLIMDPNWFFVGDFC